MLKTLIPNLIIDWGLQQFILTLVVEDWQHWIILVYERQVVSTFML